MILLPNGCRCSQPIIYGKSLTDRWRVDYRFYDADGSIRRVIIKGGLNRLKTIGERKAAARDIVAAVIDSLKEGVNPIKGGYSEPDPDNVVDALNSALKGLDCEPATRTDIKSALKFITRALKALKLADIPINQFTRKEAVLALNRATIGKSAKTFNRYRKYLGILCKYLVENMSLDSNPIREISKKSVISTIKETLSLEDRHEVDLHLKKKGLNSFRLFLRIFFSSGARITELLKVQAYNVNLKEQWFLVTIKKGKNKREVKKTIRNSALRYWKMALRGSKRSDYVFSKGLTPGPVPISAAQVTRRWEFHVKRLKEKGGLGITADLYSLKHSASTETVNDYGTRAAAEQNSHTSDAMVISIYDTNSKQREHERLKKIDVRF